MIPRSLARTVIAAIGLFLGQPAWCGDPPLATVPSSAPIYDPPSAASPPSTAPIPVKSQDPGTQGAKPDDPDPPPSNTPLPNSPQPSPPKNYR